MIIYKACVIFAVSLPATALAEQSIKWLVEYNGDARPDSRQWAAIGGAAASASVVNGALRIADESGDELGYFRAPWTADPDREIVVEAKLRVETMVSRPNRPNSPGGTSIWPFMDGAPITLMVNDGQREGGLIFKPDKITTLVDRVALMDTKRDFHLYLLVIRGGDMTVFVDGQRRIVGEGAFSRPAKAREAFIQFGSDSKPHKGESYWASVRLGVRTPDKPEESPKLRLTFSAPWEILSPPRGNPNERPYEHLGAHTRPFLHDMGHGLLLMSVAQGPDAVLEPYGVLKSVDQGRTWEPVKGMQYKSFAPQSIVRLPDGDILAVSRWTAKYKREEGVYIGMSYRFDAKAERFEMFESLIRVPKGMGDWMAFDRDIYTAGTEIFATVYGHAEGGRRAMLLRSADGGNTWSHYSTLGPRPEPSLVRFSETHMMAILRVNGWMPMEQIWSDDGGKTWTPPVTMEEGSVDADMVYMSNGVLACSYGRPGSNLMFSLDRGKTWVHHHVITETRGFNYTAIREISPGRLLYVHDAPRLQALYIDVERRDGSAGRVSRATFRRD